jgi:hypothetical protein
VPLSVSCRDDDPGTSLSEGPCAGLADPTARTRYQCDTAAKFHVSLLLHTARQTEIQLT